MQIYFLERFTIYIHRDIHAILLKQLFTAFLTLNCEHLFFLYFVSFSTGSDQMSLLNQVLNKSIYRCNRTWESFARESNLTLHFFTAFSLLHGWFHYICNMTELDTLIKMYFDVGMLYKDIVSTLSQQHNITISERHLIRKLTHLNLSRRTFSSFNDVTTFIQRQLVGSGQCHGYRMMYEKCIQHGLRVRKEDVRIILKELDPEGVESRMGRRLRRRLYYAKGPNYIWHLDGYDKLKPYGLCN